MEILVEVLLQLFIEVFGELILTAIAKLIGLFFKKLDTDNLLRRRLKFVLTYVFIGLIIVLITTSLINSTRFLVVISLTYMLFQIVMTLLQIINQDKKSHPLIKVIPIVKKISHYVYPILLIVFSFIFISESNLLGPIIIISSIALMTFIMIDMYRFWKLQKLKKEARKKKSS